MIAAVDSSFDAPSAADADAARGFNIGMWCGYLATRAGVGLAAPWPRGAFENARRCGARPIAFVSGHDDPAAVRQLAAAWDVLPCLDVEDGIRGDGAWVDGWLAASGAGLYGLLSVHRHAAPFHIAALYPGFLPSRTWPVSDPRPAEPCGWQWLGTHTGPGGRNVDSLLLDDWFGGETMDAATSQMIRDIWFFLLRGSDEPDPGGTVARHDSILLTIHDMVAGIAPAQAAAKAELDALTALVQGLGGTVSPPDLAPVLASLGRLSAHLGVGTA